MSFLAVGGECREEVFQEGAATHTLTFRLDLQLPCLDILECMDGPNMYKILTIMETELLL